MNAIESQGVLQAAFKTMAKFGDFGSFGFGRNNRLMRCGRYKNSRMTKNCPGGIIILQNTRSSPLNRGDLELVITVVFNMLQPSPKLHPLALEAHQVLNGCYRENETGYAAQATMAIINHNQEVAKLLITELSGSPAGRNAILSELRSLEREGWYRSLTDFLAHIPEAAFAEHEIDNVGISLGNAYSGMRRLGVSKVANSFKELISRQHPRFEGYLSDQEVSSIAESPTDHIVHTLRGREANQPFPGFSDQDVVDAFNDYLLRKRLSWAAELLDFCYVSSIHLPALLEANAVGELVKAMTSAESVITLRFFAHVVRDKPLYRERFEGLLGIAGR